MSKIRSLPSPGQLTVTLDFELGWGAWEVEWWRHREAAGVYRDLRPALKAFLTFLDEREIALTWATVGAMISPRSTDEFSHLPEMAQMQINRFLEQSKPETQDGRDLFDRVIGTRTHQHISSHSYSHTRFSYPGYDVDAQTTDLGRAQAAFATVGRDLHSFVFPENDVGQFIALAGNQITIARTPPRPASSRLSRLLGTPPLAHETINDLGITEQTGSMFFNWFGRMQPLRRRWIISQANRGLDQAIATGGNFHIWLHPFNLTERPGLDDELRRFLTRAAKERDAGQLDMATF